MMPCRPRLAGCKITCLHKQLVHDYRATRAAAEAALEDATLGYAAEAREHGPIVTFRDYLEQRAS